MSLVENVAEKKKRPPLLQRVLYELLMTFFLQLTGRERFSPICGQAPYRSLPGWNCGFTGRDFGHVY